MTRIALFASLAAALGVASAAHAAPPTFVPLPMAGVPIAAGAVVPAGSTIFFVSGIPGDGKLAGTQAQTMDCLTKLGKVLQSQGFDYKDVVNAKVYLVGDPTTGKMDFAGMNSAFKTFFGTATQPIKPSRVTVQVAGLASPGSLVEIELTAAK